MQRARARLPTADPMRRITRIWIVLLALLLVALARRPASPPQREPEPPRVLPSILLTGDLLLADRIGRMIEREGPRAPLAAVRETLAGAALTIGNLECPLATTGEPASKEYAFRGRPEAADALREAGYDMIALANNHTMDYGPGALLETLAALRERGLHPVGAGRDAEEARRFAVAELGSPPMKVAVLAFSNMLPTSFYARPGRPGTNPARGEAIRAQVAAARGQAELVIVLFHWGDELSPEPSASQRYLAGLAVAAGADLVVGHHPHVLQGLERRGQALIAYSLGNFLFPSRGSARHTIMLRYLPGRDGSARAEVIPCVIEGFRPRLASGEEREQILAELGARSEPMGTKIGRDGSIDLSSGPTIGDAGDRRPDLVDKAGRPP